MRIPICNILYMNIDSKKTYLHFITFGRTGFLRFSNIWKLVYQNVFFRTWNNDD